MRNLILLIMLSASLFLSAQQTEGLKTEKTTRASIMERKLPEKSKDSIAKNNVNTFNNNSFNRMLPQGREFK